MHGYIYDVFLHQKPYEKELISIEHCLTDAGLKGPIVRLSIVNSVKHAVAELTKKGVTTIVAVGGDNLFSSLVDEAIHLPEVTLGLIPMGSHVLLANQFGIPLGVQACQTLSARLVRPAYLSKINSQYFIHSIVTDDPRIKLYVNDLFSLTPTSEQAKLTIHNTSDKTTEERKPILQTSITPETEKSFFKKANAFAPSSFLAKRITIKEPRGIALLVDGQKSVNTPAVIESSHETVQVIMGRERKIQ